MLDGRGKSGGGGGRGHGGCAVPGNKVHDISSYVRIGNSLHSNCRARAGRKFFARNIRSSKPMRDGQQKNAQRTPHHADARRHLSARPLRAVVLIYIHIYLSVSVCHSQLLLLAMLASWQRPHLARRLGSLAEDRGALLGDGQREGGGARAEDCG